MIKSIEWAGEWVCVAKHDGSHVLYSIDDALDILFWLQQEQGKLLQIIHKRINNIQQELTGEQMV